MTTRPPQDWSPLDWTCDPVPGDPVVVRNAGLQFSRTADAAEGSAGHLRRLESGDGQCSDAISKIQKQAGEAAGDLDRVKIRYAGAASALMEYAGVLGHAQEASLAALHAARPANDLRRRANADLVLVESQARASQDPQERLELIDQLMMLKNRRDDARGAVADAKLRLSRAIEDRDRAASRAKGEIDDAIRTSQLNDSPWDKAKAYLPEILDVVSAGLAVLTVVLAATGVGVPLALLLAVIFFSALSATIDVSNAMDAGDEAGVVAALAFFVIGLLPGGKVAKFLRLPKLSLGVKAAGRFGKYGKTFFSFATNANTRAIQTAKGKWVTAARTAESLRGSPGAAAARSARRAAQRKYDRLVKDQMLDSLYETQGHLITKVALPLAENSEHIRTWLEAKKASPQIDSPGRGRCLLVSQAVPS